MLFEFFKRLFWKADEGSRKRKADDCAISSEERCTHSKKYCQDFVSSNHVKIINESINNSNFEYNKIKSNEQSHSSKKLKHPKNKMSNTKFEISESSMQWSPTLKTNYSEDNQYLINQGSSLEKSETFGKFTLYKTHRLTERKQYSEMLLNFITSDTENIEEELKNPVNTDHLIQLKNLKKKKFLSSIDCDCNQSFNVCKHPTYKTCSFLDSHIFLKTQSQKSLFNKNLEKKDEGNENSIKSVTRSVPIEVIKTNTLRDNLSSKQVLKQNFISEITEKYNERIEQRSKEAEELKKLTYILSKHNQLTREAALEDHLSRSMRLCEAVLDEGTSVEQSKLPELTPDMLERIELTLSVGPADEILVQGFGLKITRKDIQTLSGLNWLNDEIINFYMNLLIMRSNSENYPSVYAMNTFFYPKLVSTGHASLKRWTRKIDIFAKDLIVVPIHLGIHWCMSIIDFRNKSIQYFDSMGSPNYKCLQLLKQYLYEESIDKKKKSIDFIDWSFQCIKDIPQQMNGSDCGVFSCMFAEYVCANRNLNFSQEDMPYFRNKMVYEILTIELL